jgi:hypothetical protein
MCIIPNNYSTLMGVSAIEPPFCGSGGTTFRSARVQGHRERIIVAARVPRYEAYHQRSASHRCMRVHREPHEGFFDGHQVYR